MNSGNKLTVLHQCQSDGAALSGGDWEAGLPLSNLQVPKEYYRVARSVSADPADTVIDIDMGSIKSMQGLVLGPGNFTRAASATLTKYADAGFTTPVLSHELPRAGGRVPWGTLPFTAPYWYTGLPPAWDNPERRASLIFIFDRPAAGRYWRLEINDAANPDGYVQAGRLFTAGAWIPRFNYVPDQNAFGIRDNTQRGQMLSGATRDRRRYNPRFFSFKVDYLPEADVFGPAYQLLDVAGFDRELFIVPQPDDTEHLQQRSYFARIEQADAIAQAQAGYGHFGFQALELF